jgi:IclR family transcriptional regulator, acetate operon repressor
MQPPKSKRGRPKSFDNKPSQNTIQSLDRALDVLDLLANSGGMTLSQIAAGLDQSAATIHRVLATLEARDVVETDASTQAWHVGPAAFRLGASFLRRSSVVERSRPVMRDLMEATGETSNLGIENRGNVMFLSQVETHETIRAFFPPGTLSPMHASGIGKALLSQFTSARLDQYLRDSEREQFTGKTICDSDALRRELQQIRDQGFAFDDEERTQGMRCIAAPVLNFYGEAVAGISVSGPTHRMSGAQMTRISMLVRQAALDLSRGLGAQPPQPGG